MHWFRRLHRKGSSRHERECEAARREREALARDLHDGISQDLYATHLSLTALLGRVPDDLHEPVEALIDRQTAVIASLRALLRGQPAPGTTVDFDDLIADLDQTAHSDIGRSVRLHVDGDAPEEVSAVVAHHAVHALKEMLSNAVRHSAAEHVWAQASVDRGALTLRVDDDGLGIPETLRPGFGLGNLEARAEACGGWFLMTLRHPTGTIARWNAELTWRDAGRLRVALSRPSGVARAPRRRA